MKRTPLKRKSSKPLPKLKNKLQEVFNEYIRLRDHGRPCISCGEMKPLQAGHFYSRKGYDSIRFDEDNVHGECSGCNCFSESHLITYGLNLEKKIGKEKLNELHRKAEEYKRNGYKWTRAELEELIEEYKRKRDLEASKKA